MGPRIQPMFTGVSQPPAGMKWTLGHGEGEERKVTLSLHGECRMVEGGKIIWMAGGGL